MAQSLEVKKLNAEIRNLNEEIEILKGEKEELIAKVYYWIARNRHLEEELKRFEKFEGN